MTTIAFATLGCRVNQYDTDSIRGLFLQEGFCEKPVDEVCDVYIINTCSVTQMSEKKSRQLIRRCHKLNARAVVIVTGCYAQLDPETIASIEGVEAVVGTNEKHRIVAIVRDILSHKGQTVTKAVHDVMTYHEFEELPLYPSAVAHTRADVKIQEGCNNYCAYCIIPYTRGILKSRRIDDIVKEAKRLVDFGFREIILTGIHLGAYGEDLPEHTRLAEVIRRILAETTVKRIRLGSIESVEVRDDLIAVINSSSRVCPHLHLPIQSGSDTILKWMNRHYSKDEFIDLIAQLREKIHGLTVSTDLILGFPGETDALFSETLETMEQLRFSHIHAFPYSPRKGTPAAAFDGQVPEAIKKERVRIINALSYKQKQAELAALVGKDTTVLIEKQSGRSGEGFSDNYERVRVEGLADGAKGSIIPVRLLSVDENNILIGKVKEES